ncbi:MAG: hypothetical protein VB078_09460 [Clostridiaceae bacterium]|nr:hypothetical protein [Clostridiaceae bacterium]
MNQFDLLKHIIINCDEALKEAFEKRMSVSASLAQTKIDLEKDIFDSQSEQNYIHTVVAQFAPELSIKANSLWASLTRMSRSQQYRYLLKNYPEIRLAHEPFLCDNIPEGITVTPEPIAIDVSMSLGDEVMTCHSIQSAIDQVISGKAVKAVLSCDSIYDTESVFLSFYDKGLFVNAITRSKEGRLLFELSKNLVICADDNTMSLAFAVDNKYGSMVQALSILSEAKLSIEHMRHRRSTSGCDHPDNLIFVDLSGDFDTLETKTALYQLEKEMYFYRLIGFWKRTEF